MHLKGTTRTSLGIALILAVGLFSGAHHVARSVRRVQRGKAPITERMERWDRIRSHLPATGKVGYVTDRPAPDPSGESFQLQYALSPLIVVRGTDAEFIIGSFRDPGGVGAIRERLGLKVVLDLGEGLVLFRGKEE